MSLVYTCFTGNLCNQATSIMTGTSIINVSHINPFFLCVCVCRSENEKYEQQVCDLKARVRILETCQGSADIDLVGLAAGICVKCAQNEAVLPPSVADNQKRSIEKLTRYVCVAGWGGWRGVDGLSFIFFLNVQNDSWYLCKTLHFFKKWTLANI